MTVEELKAELKRQRAPLSAYSLGSEENETYCIVPEADGWHVYYSERGSRNSEQVLASEAAACQELLERVLRDSTVRRRMDEHGV